MNMPKMTPLPIRTKGKSFCARVFRWLFSIRKWRLLEDWTFQLPHGGPEIVIPKDFVFNGASTPRPLWILLTPTGLLLIPSLVHDFAYRYGYLWALNQHGKAYKYGEDKDRSDWDKVLGEVGKDVNGMAWITWCVQFALFIGGWVAWNRHRKKPCPPLKPSMSLAEATEANSQTGTEL